MSSLEKSVDENARMQEERLKDWAQQNYVLPHQRSVSWHPVILEEMARRDAEIAQIRENAQVWDELEAKMKAIVPLMPDKNIAIHQQHEEIPSPNFVTLPQTAKTNRQDNNGFVETGWY